jgi:hypothetical protein
MLTANVSLREKIFQTVLTKSCAHEKVTICRWTRQAGTRRSVRYREVCARGAAGIARNFPTRTALITR